MTRLIVLAATVLAVLAGCASPAPAPVQQPRATVPATTEPAGEPEPTAPPAQPKTTAKPAQPKTAAPKPQPVTAGAFCPTPGARGVTKAGKPMICRTSPTDSRDRWRTP